MKQTQRATDWYLYEIDRLGPDVYGGLHLGCICGDWPQPRPLRWYQRLILWLVRR